jgi:hypothetical protein
MPRQHMRTAGTLCCCRCTHLSSWLQGIAYFGGRPHLFVGLVKLLLAGHCGPRCLRAALIVAAIVVRGCGILPQEELERCQGDSGRLVEGRRGCGAGGRGSRHEAWT